MIKMYYICHKRLEHFTVTHRMSAEVKKLKNIRKVRLNTFTQKLNTMKALLNEIPDLDRLKKVHLE